MAQWTILCEANDNNVPKHFGFTFDTSREIWTVSGPAADRLFQTKKGKYDHHVLPTIGTTLVPESRNTPVVAILTGFTAKSEIGDEGIGNIEESAVSFKWKFDSK